jgi:5'-methylthioadenosine phosphorylase
MESAEIAIIGGSGFYSLFDSPSTFEVATSYGSPSAPITIGKAGGKTVAFLPRHGTRHTLAPHKIPSRANIDALANAGVKMIISTSAVGSLSKEYAPGDIVFFDQFVNMTHGRDDTFFDSDKVVHVGMADPYCPQLRALANQAANEMGIRSHDKGTVVVINGPRFSTKAESKFFSKQGFHVINMTQYPEVALAREKAICYLGIGIVTDYDAGLDGSDDVMPVNTADMLQVFGESVVTAKELITNLLKIMPEKRQDCTCARALDNAAVSGE